MYFDNFLGIYCLKIIMWHLIGFAVCTVGLPSLPLSVSFGAPHPTSLSSLVVCCWGCAMPSASCESKFNTCKYSKQSINQKLKTICTCQSVHTHTQTCTHKRSSSFSQSLTDHQPFSSQLDLGALPHLHMTICLILQWGCCYIHVCFPECQYCI